MSPTRQKKNESEIPKTGRDIIQGKKDGVKIIFTINKKEQQYEDDTVINIIHEIKKTRGINNNKIWT